MNRTILFVALVLSWIVTIWAIAVCFSASTAYKHEARKHQRATRPQDGFKITLRSDGSGQNEFTYNDNEESENDFLISKVVPVVISVIGAGILILQVVINSRQLRTQHAELRAYVSFYLPLNHATDPDPGVPYKMLFTCWNHGQTPATDLGFRGGIWCLDFPINPRDLPPIAPGLDEARGNLFPGEKMGDRGRGFKANTESSFSFDQIESVRQGLKFFLVGLKIQYTDVFGESHQTQEYWIIHWVLEKDTLRRAVSLVPGNSVVT